jgi:hypothetical protein
MDVSEWWSANESWRLLGYLEGRKDVSDRKWRLFVCASVRTIWDMIGEDVCRQALLVAELYADGRVGRAAAEEVQEAAELVAFPSQDGPCPRTADYLASVSILTCEGADCRWNASWVSSMVHEVLHSRIRKGQIDPRYVNREEQECRLLRDIFNPFEPFSALDRPLLTWSGGLIPRLAQAAYEERPPHGELDLARLAILCDALEEGGCTDHRLLTHLRSPGPHYRGCDALDAVLNRS